jgi:glycosyltransferase involved in cell wall biosynthesis
MKTKSPSLKNGTADCRPPLKINVCVKGSDDWLFGDLRKGFQRTHVDGVEVMPTETPVQNADGWIFIRTGEAANSPDFSRTVVCVHDLYDHDGMYGPGQPRQQALQARGVVLCHPRQRQILQDASIDLSQSLVLERPLGALREFTVRKNHDGIQFRVGWVGREHARKRTPWFAEAMQYFACGKSGVVAVLIGKGLELLSQRLRTDGIACEYFNRDHLSIHSYPALYQQLDCVVITSSTEAGPLPLFEALATGVPVVSTPVGWAPYLASKAPDFIFLADSAKSIAVHLETIQSRRKEIFASRFQIAALVENYYLDDWFREVLQLAAVLARNESKMLAKHEAFLYKDHEKRRSKENSKNGQSQTFYCQSKVKRSRCTPPGSHRCS